MVVVHLRPRNFRQLEEIVASPTKLEHDSAALVIHGTKNRRFRKRILFGDKSPIVATLVRRE